VTTAQPTPRDLLLPLPRARLAGDRGRPRPPRVDRMPATPSVWLRWPPPLAHCLRLHLLCPLLPSALTQLPSTVAASRAEALATAHRRSVRRHQTPHTHRHFPIASASSSASAFTNPCARIGPHSHLGEAHVAVFLRGDAMAAWLGSLWLAPPRPSSLPSGPLFVLVIIPRSSRAPRWALRWLTPAGRRAPAPPCRHARR
jgi:hypothetical protein